MVTGNLIPDRATIGRFVCRHGRALAEPFGELLRLCERAGSVKPGVVSVDGTRIAGNASPEVNYEFDRIAGEILAEARATDEREDEPYGEARGDQLPERLGAAEGRREFFRRRGERLRNDDADGEELGQEPEAEACEELPLEFDAGRIVARTRGRGGPVAGGRAPARAASLARHRDPIPRSRPGAAAAGGRAGELEVERRANQAYER